MEYFNETSALAIVAQSAMKLQCIDEEYCTPEICMTVIRNDPIALSFMREQPYEMYVAAIETGYRDAIRLSEIEHQNYVNYLLL